MGSYKFTADLISIMICLVILYGTLFETKIRDGRRNALAGMIGFQIFQNVIHILDNFRKGNEPYWYVALLFLCTSAGALLAMALFMHYIRLVLDSYGVHIKKRIRAMIGYVLISAAAVALIVVTGNAFDIINGQAIYLPGYQFYAVAMFFSYFFYFVLVFSVCKRVNKGTLLVLVIYQMIPLLMGYVSILVLGEYVLGHSFVTISLVLVYIMLQSRLQDTIEQEKVEYFTSMAGIYYTLHVLDLKNQSYYEYGAADVIHNYVSENKQMEMQELFWTLMCRRICEAHQEAIKDFTNLYTLASRMEGKHSIDIELINVDNRWMRFSFIRIGKDDQKLDKVFFTSQDIDDSKRREDTLIRKSMIDELTHLYNRNAYEEALQQYEESGVPEDLKYVCYDLNGLKVENDTYGHAAGDELLSAMAACLTKCYAPLGKVFRVGGDEFVVLMQGTEEQMQGCYHTLKTLCSEIDGTYIKKVEYAFGTAGADEFENATMAQMQQLADRRMYECKDAYYKETGAERRKR